MTCPTCGAENPEGSCFCEAFGTRIQPACPSCGSEYRPGARFCRACGAELAVQEAPALAAAPTSTPAVPTSFANSRYQVKQFLGEGGKKKVYLAHDTLLDREVAFALIKTEGLDEVGMTRVNRKAQAMGRLGSHSHIVTVFDLAQEQPALHGHRAYGRRGR